MNVSSVFHQKSLSNLSSSRAPEHQPCNWSFGFLTLSGSGARSSHVASCGRASVWIVFARHTLIGIRALSVSAIVCVCVVSEISGGTLSISQMFTLLMCSFSSVYVANWGSQRSSRQRVNMQKKTSVLRHPAPTGSSFQKSRSCQRCITWKNTLPELMETRHLLRTHAVEHFVLLEPKRAEAHIFALTLGSVSSTVTMFGRPLSTLEWDVSPLLCSASFLRPLWGSSHLGRGANLRVVYGIKAQMWVTDRRSLRPNPCLTSSTWR